MVYCLLPEKYKHLALYETLIYSGSLPKLPNILFTLSSVIYINSFLIFLYPSVE